MPNHTLDTVWLCFSYAKPYPRYSLAWGMGLPVTTVSRTFKVKFRVFAFSTTDLVVHYVSSC